MSDIPSLETAYQSAFESALMVQHQTPGLLFVRGTDGLNLLHRMSTNELERLPAMRERRTVFTDPVGRTIDVVTVLSLPEELLLLATPGRSEVLRDWLQRHIFFQDDVLLEVPDQDWRLTGVYGPLASEHLPLDVPASGELSSSQSAVAWAVDQPVAGYLVLLRPEAGAKTLSGHADGSADSSAYEILRIEAGQPKMGQDILEDSIPLEVGLWDAVNFEKGCYVGQEIIARMESRGKLAKQLVGVKLEEEADLGAALLQGDRTVGSLTSVVQSPRLGWIGLGTVKTKALSALNAPVRIGNNGPSAQLVDLPFAVGESTALSEGEPQTH